MDLSVSLIHTNMQRKTQAHLADSSGLQNALVNAQEGLRDRGREGRLRRLDRGMEGTKKRHIVSEKQFYLNSTM